MYFFYFYFSILLCCALLRNNLGPIDYNQFLKTRLLQSPSVPAYGSWLDFPHRRDPACHPDSRPLGSEVTNNCSSSPTLAKGESLCHPLYYQTHNLKHAKSDLSPKFPLNFCHSISSNLSSGLAGLLSHFQLNRRVTSHEGNMLEQRSSTLIGKERTTHQKKYLEKFCQVNLSSHCASSTGVS